MTQSNAELWARREASIPRGVGSMHQRFATSASNAALTDVEGKSYIDFATGIAVCNTGHANERVNDAVKAQIDRFSHVSFQVTPYESYIELAEKLNEIAPGQTPKKSLFVTTGAEAVENAIKIARAYTKRHGVIAFRGGYHGRTFMTMALTGKIIPYKAQFGPMPADLYHAKYPCEYLGVSVEDAYQSLLEVFASDIEPEATAAIILEPILGEGGFYVAPAAFMQRLRALCDQHGILLICDEIQSGFARTGQMFATNYSGIEPDLMSVAKAMAGGYPIAGVVGKADIMDAPSVGGLGGTYGGSPLGCVAGLEVLRVIEEDGLCARAMAIGEIIQSRLIRTRAAGLTVVGDVRGRGAMSAVELVYGGDVNRPNTDLTKAVVVEAAKEGLILLSCGIRSNVIRFLPALTADDATVELGMDIVERVLQRLA